jgi:hypothetical protein
MEVHHHPDLHHKKKNLKEYLLEGLMIFLAVTLGFFAETIREKISENHREKGYIVGLINNIQTDTTNLRRIIGENDLELTGIDSVLRISKNHFTNISVQDSIFYYALNYTFELHVFQFNDVTLVQLRNAGGYSLIRTNSVADSIAMYESRNNDVKLQEGFYTDYYSQTTTTIKQIFDVTLFNQFDSTYNTTHKIPSDINVLISRDTEKLNLLYNNYWIFGHILNSYNTRLRKHLEYLANFMIYLRQSYDITD